MKKLLLLLIAVCPFYLTQAQPQAQKFFIGGQLGIFSSSEKQKTGGTVDGEQYYTYFSIVPKVGYFLSERLAVGVQTGVSGTIYKYPDSNPEKRTSTSFVFQPFGRYYLTSGTGGIFAEAGFGISAGKTKTFFDGNTAESNETSLSISVGPGLYYYITPGIALEAKIGVLGFSTDIEKAGDQKTITNEFDFEFFPAGIWFGATFIL